MLVQRTAHLSSVIPANDTRESLFGHRNVLRREQGKNLEPLTPEANALTTELPCLPVIQYARFFASQSVDVDEDSDQNFDL